MSKEKFYFRNEDETFCYNLKYFQEDMKDEGVTEMEVFEAVPDNGDIGFIWCHLHDLVNRCDCKKSECSDYESKSGRGVCSNRGKLYLHGEKVTIQLTTSTEGKNE